MILSTTGYPGRTEYPLHIQLELMSEQSSRDLGLEGQKTHLTVRIHIPLEEIRTNKLLEPSTAVLSAEWFDWKSHVARSRYSPLRLPLQTRRVTERTTLPARDSFALPSICSHRVCPKYPRYSYLRPFGNEPCLRTLSHAMENVTWQSANASLGLIGRI